MAFTVMTSLIAAVCAGVCICIALSLILRNLSRQKIRSLVIGRDINNYEIKRLFQSGLAVFIPISKIMLKLSFVGKAQNYLVLGLARKQIATNSEKSLSVVIGLEVCLFIITSLLTQSFVCSVIVTSCLYISAVIACKTFLEKNNQQLREAIPDALRLMDSCFRSGRSLMQTFEELSKECDGTLKELFQNAYHTLKTGGTTPEALEALQSQKTMPELAFVAMALDVQHESGGSMKQILDCARDTVKSELELLRMLKVQTAQARLSARVVSVLPFALLGLFSYISPGFLNPFFESATGIALFIIAIVIQFSGIMLVRKILNAC